jgi:hypothetical protein
MAKWFGKPEDDPENAGKSVEAKFTSIEATLATQNAATTKVTETIGTLAESMAAINKRFADEDKARAKATKDAADRKAAETVAGRTQEDEFNDMAENPANYIQRQTQGVTNLALLTAANLAKKEVLESKEYYAGKIKEQTDALIEGETNLARRAMVAFINNCYKIALADNMELITKGEAKRNASMHSFSDGNNGGGRNSDPDAKPTVEFRDSSSGKAAKSKYAAKELGITDEDVIAAAKAGDIHGLEVVA